MQKPIKVILVFFFFFWKEHLQERPSSVPKSWVSSQAILIIISSHEVPEVWPAYRANGHQEGYKGPTPSKRNASEITAEGQKKETERGKVLRSLPLLVTDFVLISSLKEFKLCTRNLINTVYHCVQIPSSHPLRSIKVMTITGHTKFARARINS